MESLFQAVGLDQPGRVNEIEDEGLMQYEVLIKSLIEDAVDYNFSQLSPIREKAIKYYEGLEPALEFEDEGDAITGDYMAPDDDDVANRSAAISSDVRDTVLAILPSLMRIFFGAENVINFDPRRQDQDELAKQQTDYINDIILNENDGFLLLYGVLKDAMTQKIGVVKWWSEVDNQVKQREYNDLSIMQLVQTIDEFNEGEEKPQAEIVELVPSTVKEGWIDKVVIQYVESNPRHIIDAVPPEEFRIDRRARTLKKARLVGQQTLVTPSYLVQLGIPQDVVDDYRGKFEHYTVEADLRTPGIDVSHIQQELVEYGEYFIYVDQDGDGIDELHKICVIGDNHDIVDDVIVDHINYGIFCGDPKAHTVIGDCVADITMDIQKINSQILRGSLDSLSASMFSDYVVNEMTTDVETMMSDGIGKIIRTKGDPNAAVMEFKRSFIGDAAFNMMGVMDAIRQRRTGISEASKGLDPKALQSTNVMGVDAIVTGSQERIELIARVFAETGFKDMFQGLVREVTQFPNIKKTIKLRGKWVDVDHSLFDPNMVAKVNPTMGKGSDMNRLMALNDIKQTQLLIIEKYGPGNKFVTPINFRNTIVDILELANIKNVDRYFGQITEEEVLAMQNAPKEPSPEELIAQATIEEVKAKTAGKIADNNFKAEKQAMDEDFRRDKLTLDTWAKITPALAKIELDTAAMALPLIQEENEFNG